MIAYLRKESLNNNEQNQFFWARKNEHQQQTIVLTKTAGQQPASGGHCYLRSSAWGPGVTKICDTITQSWKSVLSSQLCINTMLIEMNGSHWLKRNLLLNEGFDNSLKKICCSSVNSQRDSKTPASWVLAIVMWCKGLCQIYQFQTTLQATLQGNGDSTSIIIIKIYQFQTTLQATLEGNGDSTSIIIIIIGRKFSSKAEMIEFKEILKGETNDPKLSTY